jgi:intracellular multiplication protein IcmG
MADEYDEYQFADLDAENPESEENAAGEEPKAMKEESSFSNKNLVLRNAIIAVGCLLLLFLIYKVISSFTSKSASLQTVTAPTGTEAPVAAFQPPAPESFQPPASSTPSLPSTSVITEPAPKANQIEAKLSSITNTQQNMQSQVTSMNNQLTGVSNNVNTLMEKMVELNRTIEKLNAQVDTQYRVIEQITIRMQPKKPKQMPANLNNTPMFKYYLQAVIPGRAWLIATNGTTLTVREGTIIQGYGVVKLIDPTQGRVLTSSGKEIRFSQDDS